MVDLRISIDDYNPGNIELAKLIKSYGLEKNTIFFIDLGGERHTDYKDKYAWYLDSSSENEKQIKELSDMGFEIGSHNLWHDNDLKNKGYEEQKWQIFSSKFIIEHTTGKPCKHYCFNRGRSSEQIRQLVKEAGYEDARGTKVLSTTEPEDKFNMETTIHCFERSEYGVNDWAWLARGIFRLEVIDDGVDTAVFYKDKKQTEAIVVNRKGYYHIWAHYKELSRPGEMDKFKSILEYVKNKK